MGGLWDLWEVCGIMGGKLDLWKVCGIYGRYMGGKLDL